MTSTRTHKQLSRITALAGTVGLALTLAACGGGGTATPTPVPTQTVTVGPSDGSTPIPTVSGIGSATTSATSDAVPPGIPVNDADATALLAAATGEPSKGADFTSPAANVTCAVTAAGAQCTSWKDLPKAPSNCTGDGPKLTGLVMAPGKMPVPQCAKTADGATPPTAPAVPAVPAQVAIRPDGSQVACLSMDSGILCTDPAAKHGFYLGTFQYRYW